VRRACFSLRGGDCKDALISLLSCCLHTHMPPIPSRAMLQCITQLTAVLMFLVGLST
jgi:hypothetical protein